MILVIFLILLFDVIYNYFHMFFHVFSVNSIVFNILIDDLQSSLIYSCHSSYVIRFVGNNLPSVRQHHSACLGFPCARSRHSLVWGRDELPVENDQICQEKSLVEAPDAPNAQGQHASANSWVSLSRGPCGNAYMQFLRVYAWIRASPGWQSQTKTHLFH